MLDTSKWYFRWRRAQSVEEFNELVVNPEGYDAVELKEVVVREQHYEALSDALFASSCAAIA